MFRSWLGNEPLGVERISMYTCNGEFLYDYQGKMNVMLIVCDIVFFRNIMDSAGDAASNGPTEGEVNQPQGHVDPPVMTSAERVETAMTQFLENQTVYM